MPILSWIGALVVLLVGALTLNGVSQSLEGRDSVFIHFGWVTLILLVGGALFPFWGWTSTGWVLGVAAAWSIVPPLAGRLLGDGVPSGHIIYHGDPHGAGDAEDNARSGKNSGGPPPSDVLPDEHHKVEYHKGYPGKLREYRSKDRLKEDESDRTGGSLFRGAARRLGVLFPRACGCSQLREARPTGRSHRDASSVFVRIQR